MRLKKRITAVLAATMILMTGCASSQDGPNTSKQVENAQNRPQTIKLAGGKDWGAPNPYLHATRGPGNAKKDLIFASLLEADEKGVVGWLAQSWEVKGNDYTFTLYNNSKFHDGKPLTTADIEFTINYYKQFPPLSNPLGTGEQFLIKDYEIIDDKTIKLSVAESNANTLTALGGFEILPKHIWENVTEPEAFTAPEAFIGSGAYKFSQYEPATGSYEFTAFDDFVAFKPGADKIQFVPTSDELLAFENGEIDITSVPADLFAKYSGDDTIGFVEKTNDMGYKMLVNFEKRPEFLDIERRKALYYAIDRADIVNKVFRGMGAVGSAGYAPEGSLYFNENCEKYDYNPEEATKIFKDKDIEVTMIAANSGKEVKIAELIKINLESVGIKMNVVTYDSAVRDEMINKGDYEFALVGNGGWGGKAPTYMRTIFSDVSKNKGGNPHAMGPIGYSNAKITELAEAQQLETDFNKRVEIFKELQLEVSKEVPLVVIGTESSYSMYKKDYYAGWMKTYDYQQAEQNRLSYMVR